jgi:hypothetical protein
MWDEISKLKVRIMSILNEDFGSLMPFLSLT